MAITPGELIAAPAPGRRRYGLFDAANGPLDLPAHSQGGGVRYVPLDCGEGTHAYPVDCDDPPSKAELFEGVGDEIATGVFAVLAALQCSPVGYSEAELENAALRKYEAGEQAAVERAFWGGLDFDGNALGIRSLTSEAVAISSNFDPDDKTIAELVGELERYAYSDQGYGYQAVIHAPIEVAAFAFHEGLVLLDGNRKVTPMGSVWDFGAYPSGSVIITGQTTVWRSNVDIVSSFDRVNNQVLIIPERTYAIAFDCFAGRASYDPLEVTSP